MYPRAQAHQDAVHGTSCGCPVMAQKLPRKSYERGPGIKTDTIRRRATPPVFDLPYSQRTDTA